MNNDNNTTKNILQQISEQEIQPKARWRFQVRNIGVWVLGALSVVVGALAVSAIIYVLANAGWQFYQETHDNALTFTVEMLPYLWIGLMFIFGGIAYYNIRHTKHGYRYKLASVLMAVVLGSIALGGGVYAVGGGAIIDNQIGKKLPGHTPIYERQQNIWSQPDHGRLGGVIINIQSGQMVLEDFQNTEWNVDISEVPERALERINNNDRVRVLGYTPETANQNEFTACMVKLWEFKGERSPRPPHTDNPSFKPIKPYAQDFQKRPGEMPRKQIEEDRVERKIEHMRSNGCEGARPSKPLQDN